MYCKLAFLNYHRALGYMAVRRTGTLIVDNNYSRLVSTTAIALRHIHYKPPRTYIIISENTISPPDPKFLTPDIGNS